MVADWTAILIDFIPDQFNLEHQGGNSSCSSGERIFLMPDVNNLIKVLSLGAIPHYVFQDWSLSFKYQFVGIHRRISN